MPKSYVKSVAEKSGVMLRKITQEQAIQLLKCVKRFPCRQRLRRSILLV